MNDCLRKQETSDDIVLIREILQNICAGLLAMNETILFIKNNMIAIDKNMLVINECLSKILGDK